MDIKFTLTLIISSGALLFSFLNYKRGQKFENENFIYKTKIDIYAKILAELNKLLNVLQDNLEEAEEYFKDPSDENLDLLNEQADEVDDLCFAFKDFIISNSLIIPESVLTALNKFCDKVLDTDTLDSETKNGSTTITDIEKAIDELVLEADQISVLLRKDLHIDELNSSLYRRLK
jgi:hypothetical protein